MLKSPQSHIAMATAVISVDADDQVETNSFKKPKLDKRIQVVDVEDDVLCFNSVSRSRKGTTRSTAIFVEQYADALDLRLAIMASLLESRPDSFVDLSLENNQDGNDDDDDVQVLRFKPTRSTAISVEQYAEALDPRLALMASLLESRPDSFVDLSLEDNQDGNDDDDEVQVLTFKPSSTLFGNRRKPHYSDHSVAETGESSASKRDASFVCEICVEPKTENEMFKINGCSHAYCTECMVKYVASKLQDNVSCIRCPVSDCHGLLEPAHCRSILPGEVFDRWGNALCEALILGSQKFYCPYNDCSALLIDDGTEVVSYSECPNCRRMFCAQCKVPWHFGIDCDNFQKLKTDERERDDIMLMKLAQNNKWSRCPSCRFYVEKFEGCMFMKCRCGTSFCYSCGTATTRDHYCSKCQR